jgi:hypothetical protein
MYITRHCQVSRARGVEEEGGRGVFLYLIECGQGCASFRQLLYAQLYTLLVYTVHSIFGKHVCAFMFTVGQGRLERSLTHKLQPPC